MINYQTLCEQFQRFERQQQDFTAHLKSEIAGFTQALANDLGLRGKTYSKVLGGDEQIPYVDNRILNVRFDQNDLPIVDFALMVTLETKPNLYPKTVFETHMQLSYLQSDRVQLAFTDYPPNALVLNLNDDEILKGQKVTELVKQRLMARLCKVAK